VAPSSPWTLHDPATISTTSRHWASSRCRATRSFRRSRGGFGCSPIVTQIPEEENEAFRAIGYTIGGMMIWPCNPVDGRRTINVERGFNQKIADRMDLTLECIRRHYVGQPSPLDATLERHARFFALFGDFRGFVEHFYFQDLTTTDHSEVVFFMPFDDFTPPAVPRDVATYLEYRRRSIDFIAARNSRIDEAVNLEPGNELGRSLTN
jgi:hypothetical protein